MGIMDKLILKIFSVVFKALLRGFLNLMNIKADLTNYAVGQFMRIILVLVFLVLLLFQIENGHIWSFEFWLFGTLSIIFIGGVIRAIFRLRWRNSIEPAPQVIFPKNYNIGLHDISFPSNWKITHTDSKDEKTTIVIESNLFFIARIICYQTIESPNDTIPINLELFVADWKEKIDKSMLLLVGDSIRNTPIQDSNGYGFSEAIREEFLPEDDYGKQKIIRESYSYPQDQNITFVVFQYVLNKNEDEILRPGINMILSSLKIESTTNP
jgi:hypothetical protein